MKKKKARIIEIYEEVEEGNTITKRIEVYTDYDDGYSFGTQIIVPKITPKAISEMLSTISNLQQEGFEIKFCFIEEKYYSEQTLEKCLH